MDISMVSFSQQNAPAKRKFAPHEQVLIDFTSQFMSLSDAEINTILDMVTIKAYKKGKLLLREGQIGHICYFVLQGCVRQYYLVDGIEKTTDFFTEGQPVSPTLVFENKPSKSYLVCNEDCIVVEGTSDDEQAFLMQMPRMETLSRIGIESELQRTHEVHAEYVIASPMERYKNLLQNRPELLDRVPQYQLASYLGITPESLSRIRKRIMKK
jgi:CRP-like cAMP-binding protein